MIRHAIEQDIIELKQLWDISFDDPLNYVDFIYKRVAQPADTLVYDAGNLIAAMMTLVPVNFVYGDQAVRAIYIYGAATHPRFQARGLMRNMLTYAEDFSRGRGCELSVLVPGEAYLFDYYRKRGYSPDFQCRLVTVKPGMIPTRLECDTTPILNDVSAKAVFRLREQCLADMPHIAWTVEQMDFVLEDLRIYNDQIAHYKGEHGESYAVFHLDKRRLDIKECFGDDDARLALIKEIIQQFAPKSTRIRLPVNSTIFPYEGEVVRYGMAKPLNVSTSIKDMDPYMNLMLD